MSAEVRSAAATNSYDSSPTGIYADVLTHSSLESGYHYSLGNISNILIIISTLIMFILTITLNLGVLSFYRKEIKNLVPFIYSILAGSDFCTGVCTGIHSLIFFAIVLMKNGESIVLYWLVFLTYFTTMITFRLSAFVSLTFSVIRTINILSPFRKINVKAVCLAIAVYFTLLLALTLFEIVLLETNRIKTEGEFGAFMVSHFYRPSSLNQLFIQVSNLVNGEMIIESISFCAVSWVSVLPNLLPAAIALVATFVQIYMLMRKDVTIQNTQNNAENKKKRVSITIAIISSFFFFCSLFSLALPITSCYSRLAAMDLQRKQLILYMSLYMSMFLNATLNPLILIIRGEKLNIYIRNKLRLRRSVEKCENVTAATVTQSFNL